MKALIEVFNLKYLIFCIIITALLELLISFAFGYRKKKLIAIAIVSMINNLYLYTYFFENGASNGWFLVIYPIVKLIIFIVEAIVYNALFVLIAAETIPVWKNILYAFTANIASLILGVVLLAINEGML